MSDAVLIKDGAATAVFIGTPDATSAAASASAAAASATAAAASAASVGAVAGKITAAEPSGFAGGFADSFGRYFMTVRVNGSVVFSSLEATTAKIASMTMGGSTIAQKAPIGFSYAWGDAYGRFVAGIKNSGEFAVPKIIDLASLNGLPWATISDAVIAQLPAILDAEINGFCLYGQSKPAGTQSAPVLTTAQLYDGLRFSDGVRPYDAGTPLLNALVPLIETDNGGTGVAELAETPASGMEATIKQRLLADSGIAFTDQPYQMLMFDEARGGTPISGLKASTAPYNEIKAEIAAMQTLARALGKTSKFRGFAWSQGESDYQAGPTDAGVTTLTITAQGSGGTDGTYAVAFSGGGGSGAAATFTVSGGKVVSTSITANGTGYTTAPTISLAGAPGLTGATMSSLIGTPPAAYRTALTGIQTGLDAYAKSLNSENGDVICFIDQVYAHATYGHANDPYLALLQLAMSEDTPNFVLVGNFANLPNRGYPHWTNQGSQWAGAYYARAYKRLIIEKGAWEPLKPVDWWRDGNVVMLRFAPESGQLAIDTASVAAQTNQGLSLVDSSGQAIAISSVALIGRDMIKITAASAVPAGARIQAGYAGQGKTNIRDTMGDSVTSTIGTNTYALHNWCVIFEKTLA